MSTVLTTYKVFITLLTCVLWLWCPTVVHAQMFTSYPYAPGSNAAYIVPVCTMITIPSGNTIGSTTTETQFATVCYIKAGSLYPGTVLHVDTRFMLGVSATVPTLAGRIYLARSITPNLTTCIVAVQCFKLLDTGNIGGLTGGSNLYGNADVSCTFQTVQNVECSGQLNFQTGATAVLAISAQSAGSPGSGAVTVPWDTTSNDMWLVYTATWSNSSVMNYIQMRQQTIK